MINCWAILIGLAFSINLGCANSAMLLSKTPPRNPVNYTFKASLLQVQNAIKNAFAKLPGYRYMQLEYNDKETVSSKAKATLSLKSNENDFFLHYSGSIGKSKIYFDKNGVALDYYAAFHLHVIFMDSLHTQVEVKTINPQVGIGKKALPSAPHMVRMEKTKVVRPSTIEEYEILLRIGTELGVVANMPKLALP
ncbi:MAG: hypothetical protein Q8M15_05835 [Bacteroidota bacterium]|nr:hypothetical protein [Bacteroidota bacterium]